MLQCVSTYSSCDSAIKQKADILQSKERQEKDHKICDRQVHEVALRPLDQTQGTKLLQSLNPLKQLFRADLLFSGVNRLATKRNCGRRNLPDERG